MNESLKAVVLWLLRVPPEPELPAGTPGSVRTFRAAENYYQLKLFLWGIRQLSGLVGIVVFLAIWHSAARDVPRHIHLGVDVLKIVGIAIFLLQLPFTYAMVRLDYEMRWYIVTDRSLRIRAGLWQVREMTLTFANIQQITVHQGPLQRLLGIYDLEVSTAGGGGRVSHGHGHGIGPGNESHRGFFHGIDHAPEIRDMMLERLRQQRDTGLGDPDEHHDAPKPGQLQEHSTESTGQPGLLEAAREMLREAQALRRAAL
jgi:membrane protein YdbS with pleckstrin-like domain